MYTKYKSEMELLIASINDLDKKLERPMNDLDDIRYCLDSRVRSDIWFGRIFGWILDIRLNAKTGNQIL